MGWLGSTIKTQTEQTTVNTGKLEIFNNENYVYQFPAADLEYMDEIERGSNIAGCALNMFIGTMISNLSRPTLFKNTMTDELKMSPMWDYLFEKYWVPVIKEMFFAYHARQMYMYRIVTVEEYGKLYHVPKTVHVHEGIVYCEHDPKGEVADKFYFSVYERNATNLRQANEIRYDPTVAFLFGTMPVLNGTNINQWRLFVNNPIDIHSKEQWPDHLSSEWINTPLGRILPDWFLTKRIEQYHLMKHMRSVKTAVALDDKTPLDTEKLANFIDIHRFSADETQEVLQNLEMQRMFSSRVAPRETSAPQGTNGAGIVDTEFAYQNGRVTDVMHRPQRIGKPMLSTSDIRESLKKSLVEASFVGTDVGFFEYIVPGAMYTPKFAPTVKPDTISEEVERCDRVMSEAHGIFVSGSKATVRTGEESLKLEMEKNRVHFESIRSLLEQWIGEILNLIYGNDMNEGLSDSIEDTMGVDVVPDKIENRTTQDFNRVLFRFNPRWKTELDLLVTIWDRGIFDVEMTQERFGRLCDVDPAELEWYRKNPSEMQRKRDELAQAMLNKGKENGKQSTNAEKNKEKKKKNKEKGEDTTPSKKKRSRGEKEPEESVEKKPKKKKKGAYDDEEVLTDNE